MYKRQQEDVISITPQFCYGHEPNLEYLTESADLIVSGIVYTSSFNYNVQNTFIYTNMNIQVTKVLKNNTESTLSGSDVYKRQLPYREVSTVSKNFLDDSLKII